MLFEEDTVFFICYKNKTLRIKYNPDALLGDIKEECAEITSVEPSNQKLIYKKILKDEMRLSETPILPGARVTLIATSSKELGLLQKHEAKIKERVTILPSRPRSTKGLSINKYTFKMIEALPDFPDQRKALDYLQRLKEDPGICAIMEKHRWEVKSLIELSPSEKAILGYNRNKGHIIALRLRTDDLTGFINYSSVRKVLLHELAHMEFAAHDKSFHELNQQLNLEVKELDWTQSKARTTCPKFESHKGFSSASSLSVSGKKLGGKRINMDHFNSDLQFRREVISKAIDYRLSKDEEELALACDVSQVDDSSKTDSKSLSPK